MRKLISRKEAAKLLGIDPRTFDTHFRPYLDEIRLGNKILFLEKDIDNLIDTMLKSKKLTIKKILKELSV